MHTDLHEFYGMRCVCATGFTGVFCEELIAQSLAAEERVFQDEYADIPVLCKNVNNKAEIKKQPVRHVRTPHANASYFLVQGGLIWYVNENDTELGISFKNAWPRRLSDVFPTVEDNIDAILFDGMNSEYLIFKVRHIQT